MPIPERFKFCKFDTLEQSETIQFVTPAAVVEWQTESAAMLRVCLAYALLAAINKHNKQHEHLAAHQERRSLSHVSAIVCVSVRNLHRCRLL